ncbi:MAG: adenylate kinase [Chloroflexota bacterium]
MPPDAPMRRRVILLFGGPAAGKGTQADLLSAALVIPHVSSGDLLRDHQRRSAEAVMQRGDLLPDDVVSDVVFARLAEPDARAGAVLDGFPRTLPQAEALDRWLQQQGGGTVSAAFYLEVPRPEMIARVVSRGEVSQRSDDHADVARRRVEVFLHELPPVLDYYAARGVVLRVDGTQSVEQVHQQIVQALSDPHAKSPARDGR